MTLEWTKQLSVGNSTIDLEHQNLVRITNNILRAAGAGDRNSLANEFALLRDSLDIHFVNEEMFAQAVEFDFSKHKSSKQDLLKELQHIQDELTSNVGERSEKTAKRFSRILRKWMIDDHIIKLDMPMKPSLQTRDYSFLPGCHIKPPVGGT